MATFDEGAARRQRAAVLSSVDLFCGAGGLTAGLEVAGWTTVAAVDNDRDCIETIRRTKQKGLHRPGSTSNFLESANLLRCDVRDIGRRHLVPEGSSEDWRPDLLAGGPPCQPFSSAGRMLGLSDPRGQLFLDFVRLADELNPRFILFENVAGLVTARGPDGSPGGVLAFVQSSFEEVGYACRFALVNAADFGAPQRRVRLFMIGSKREKLPEFPQPTHGQGEQSEPLLLERWRALGEFLEGRPQPDPSEVVYAKGARAQELAGLVPGTGLRARGIVEANRPGGHWGYRQDCFVADPRAPARTIRAASTPDWIKLQNGKLRRLTWRECAALQGFPEEWEFFGTVASKFRQIGNAVQGDVAAALGNAIAVAASCRRTANPQSVAWPAAFHRRVKYTKMEERVNGAHRTASRRQVS